MRIYADSTTYALSDFAGKNLWIKVKTAFPPHTQYWARVIKYWDFSYNTCNIIPVDSTFDNLSDFYEETNKATGFSIDALEIIYPIVMISSDALLQQYFPDDTASNLKLLRRYAGKDVWVRCRIFTSGVECSNIWYINIFDIDDADVVQFKMLHSDYVDYPDWGHGVSMSKLDKFSCYADEIEILHPIDLLTDSELQEILQDNNNLIY